MPPVKNTLVMADTSLIEFEPQVMKANGTSLARILSRRVAYFRKLKLTEMPTFFS